jgi:hypothetical protein
MWRKIRRSTDMLVLALECMTIMLTSHFKENANQWSKIAETIVVANQQKLIYRYKLNDEFQEIESLSFSKQYKVGMILVKNADLLDFFF